MPFKDLETRTLADYLDAERTRAGDFWLFMHIPKTAGSSFSAELSSRLSPYKNIHGDYENRNMPLSYQLEQAAKRFVAEQPAAQFASASGHLPFEFAGLLRDAIPQTRLITFLRTPESRVISDYRYQRTPMHPPYREFIKKYPDIESYIETTSEQNKMTRFVTGRHRTPDEAEVIAHLRENFSFVGLLEMYPMSFSIAFDLMGHPGLTPTEHARKTPDTAETDVTITEEVRSLIRKCNRVDQAMYDYVRSVLVPRREEWAASLSA